MKKVCVIYGGKSTENEVSKMSAKAVIDNIDKDKYEIEKVYISKEGEWLQAETHSKIEDIFKFLKSTDVVFPVLHGLYGEDGTIQGLLEIVGVPYVGCNVLASCVGMDKVYTKVIFEKAGFNQAKYIVIRKCGSGLKYISTDFSECEIDKNGIISKVESTLRYPVYVKPSNSGSSVGVKKVESSENLISAIENSAMYDEKILIEEGIDGREIECAVMGNEDLITSCTGEVKPAEDFYSFDAKYKKAESKVVIPADIDIGVEKLLKELSKKAYRAIDAKGLSRVDFFLERGTGKIYINEINTMPGFTQISMFPKLFEAVGISYKELLTNLIELA